MEGKKKVLNGGEEKDLTENIEGGKGGIEIGGIEGKQDQISTSLPWEKYSFFLKRFLQNDR